MNCYKAFMGYRQKDNSSRDQKHHLQMAVTGHLIQVQSLLFLSALDIRECVNYNYLIIEYIGY